MTDEARISEDDDDEGEDDLPISRIAVHNSPLLLVKVRRIRPAQRGDRLRSIGPIRLIGFSLHFLVKMHEQRGNFCIFILKVAEKEGKPDLRLLALSRVRRQLGEPLYQTVRSYLLKWWGNPTSGS